MTNIKNFLYKIYDLILNNPFCSALILFICLLLKLNLSSHLLPITFAIAALAVLSFNKRFSFLQSFIFAICFLVFEIIVVVFVMKNAMFASLTLIYQGLFILLAILLRALSVFLAYYLTNIILYKILNSEKIKNKTQNFVKFFRQDSFVLILLSVFVLCTSLHYSVKYFQTVPVKVSSFSELKDYVYGFGNQIYLLNDDKLCFLKRNQIIVYDLKNHEVYDSFEISDFNNISLDNTVIKVRTENRILPLSNGDILIQQNYIPEKRKDYDYNSKTYIKIYSPKKGEISSLEIPFVSTFTSLTELPDNKILFIGNKSNQTFIYDINNNTYYRTADMNYERSGASAIILNDGRVFVFSGQSYPNNCAEIYDVQKNTFEKIPLNFNVHNYINTVRLSKLNDSRILIQCEKAMENKNDGIGNSDGFRTPDGNFVTVYPVPYLTIFNPQDNSFEEIDINKNSNKIRIEYDTAVLKNGNIIIAGGGNIEKNSKKKRNIMKNTKDILVYNPQNRTIKKTFGELKYDHFGHNNILTVLNDGTVLVTGNIYNKPNKDNQIEALTF